MSCLCENDVIFRRSELRHRRKTCKFRMVEINGYVAGVVKGLLFFFSLSLLSDALSYLKLLLLNDDGKFLKIIEL